LGQQCIDILIIHGCGIFYLARNLKLSTLIARLSTEIHELSTSLIHTCIYISDMNIQQTLIGFFFGILIAILAWRLRALSESGGWAAALTGGLIFGLGGFPWACLLLAFFISSSVLSRAFRRRKAALAEKFSKGSRRDWGQVFANGGLGALLAVAYAIWPGREWLWVAFAGAMAAVNADTWATELGVLNPVSPRLITNGRPVERGTSGAISVYGTLAALGGAMLIGLIAAAFSASVGFLWVLLVATLSGLMGAMVDSLLGATVQAIYRCPACDKETERYPLHLCGSQTFQVRGWHWMNNDMVNFICSLVGASVAVLIWLVFL
jgi:uncharacterized protein (TIGR00297 family)